MALFRRRRTQSLLRDLRRVRVASDERLRAEFDRSLPFGDAIFDRWERAARLGFAKGVSIYDSALVFGDVVVGARTWIGPTVVLDGSGGSIEIGHHCSISAGVHVYTHDTVAWALTGGAASRNEGAVEIGDCTYVGPQSVIAAGTTIGRQCVVGAHAFVREDVESQTIVAGVPARVIGRVIVEDDGTITLDYGDHPESELPDA